jgi:hypothetical protein
MTIARYDVNNANVNRHVRFFVEPTIAAERVANVFLALKGPANVYPFYNAVTGTPTANQELAQLRLSLCVRTISRYTVPVSVQVVENSDGEAGGAFFVTYEVDEFGAFFNQRAFTVAGESWPLDPTDAKHHVDDITDFLGTGGMPLGPKTKPGLQSMLDELELVSFDGGVTGPFGDLSTSGAITLPDGQVSAGAPVLDNNGGGATTPSGFVISFAGIA